MRRVPVPFSLPVLVAVAMLYAGWTASPVLGDLGGDNAVYWLTANQLSPWADALPVAAHFAERSIYPPLYPAVLAALGGGGSLRVAHLLSAALLVGGLAALIALGRAMGLRAGAAAALVGLVALLRVTLLQGLQLHSEHLYFLLSALALALAAADEVGQRRVLAVAVCVVAAYFARTAALALAGAFLLWVVLHHRRVAPAAVALVAVPILAWSTLHGGSAHYVDHLLRGYAGGDSGARLAGNLAMLWRAWQRCFAEPGMAGVTTLLPAALGALALAGSALRLRRLALDGLYVVAYLVMLSTWPFAAEYERMLYPLLPVLLVHGLVAMQGAGRLLRVPGPAPSALYLAGVLAALLPFLMLAAQRFATLPDVPGFEPYRRTVAWYIADPHRARLNIGYQRGIREALAVIRNGDLLAPTDCVLTTKPPIVALYAERHARALPRERDSSAAFLKAFRAQPCRALFMMQAASPTFPRPYHPHHLVADRIAAGRLYPNLLNPQQPVAMLAFLEDAAAR